MFRIAMRTLRFRKGAFVATFLAMTIGAMLVLACGGLMETGIRGEVPAQRLANTRFVVTASQTWALPKADPNDPEEDTDNGFLGERVRLPESLVAELSRVPGVTAAIGDVSVPVLVEDARVDAHGWSSASLTPVTVTSGTEPVSGEVVLGTDSGARVGERVSLGVRGEARTFTVSGLVPGSAVFFADTDVDRLAGHPGTVDLIGLRASADAGDRIAKVLDGRGANLLSGDERGIAEYPDAGQAGENLIVLAAVFGGLAVMVMLFVVSTTLGLSIQQRQRELALLRAVGTTPGQLRRMVVGESLFIAVFATALGCGLGGLFGRWLFDRLASGGVVPTAMTHHTGWIPMVVAVGAVLIGSFFGALIAGRRAARTRPTEALADASIQRRWLSWVRVVLAVLAFGGGIALFIVTVAVMTGPIAASTAGPSVMLWAIALALVSPGITKVVLAILRWPVRAFTGTAGYLATLSTKTRAIRVAAVVTPVMLATGMATANIYLQTTSTAVANEAYVENLRADLVLSGDVPEGLVDEVRRVPGVRAASEYATSTVYVEKPYDPDQSEDGWQVQGVSGEAAAQTTAVEVSEGRLADLTGNAIALPTSDAAALNRGVGDTITMRMGDGAQVRVRIVALYPSREGFETVLMPAALVASHTTSGLPSQIMIRADDPAAVVPALADLARSHPGLAVVDRDTLVSSYAKGQEIGAWINYLMAGMIVAYTAISVVNSLVMSIGARRREFGLQRLTGATRGQILRMMTVEAGLTTVIGVLFGTVVAFATLVPFTLVTDGSLMPKGPLAIYLGVTGAVALLTFGATLFSTWVGLRIRPAEAAVAPA
ncbi:FtsX-like permease family protein [Actinophytocola oryzae]|uniref:Putative ABC transport system permease protein n=1 Tax=Actinophytocola oryzae TaxID=502181 RepID=A0A4R7VNP2_9PSEU|nr:FtsX-like permease family protein [Actinophytocola oryzae]TDV50958.1 putative ABC transport system permease protein [Actinophytocola oryzae]